jgi:hypothetical protein
VWSGYKLAQRGGEKEVVRREILDHFSEPFEVFPGWLFNRKDTRAICWLLSEKEGIYCSAIHQNTISHAVDTLVATHSLTRKMVVLCVHVIGADNIIEGAVILAEKWNDVFPAERHRNLISRA